MAVDQLQVQRAVMVLLAALGEDVTRDGLRDTPARVARFWAEFLDADEGNTATAFEGIQCDEMVVLSGFRVYSLCEHHLLPFWVDLAVGYIPVDGYVLGLSKLARLARKEAHTLQLQERLVNDVADAVLFSTKSPDVAVFGRGTHLCLSMRGVAAPAQFSASALRGAFKDDAATRAEFFAIAREGSHG